MDGRILELIVCGFEMWDNERSFFLSTSFCICFWWFICFTTFFALHDGLMMWRLKLTVALFKVNLVLAVSKFPHGYTYRRRSRNGATGHGVLSWMLPAFDRQLCCLATKTGQYTAMTTSVSISTNKLGSSLAAYDCLSFRQMHCRIHAYR